MAIRSNQPAGTRERIAERRVKALQLRQGGATYRDIARALGVDVRVAHMDVDACLKQLAAQQHHEAEKLRALELGRLDDYLLGLQALIRAGDLAAINTAIRLSQERRKMLGLDAPAMINWRQEAERDGLDADAIFAATVERIKHDLAGGHARPGEG